MNISCDVINSVESQFSTTEEFGLVVKIDEFILSSAIISLNRKDVQFTLTGNELLLLLRAINGVGDNNVFCVLRPAAKSEVPAYVGLRVLQIGRFMIHFTDAELDRFRYFINKKFSDNNPIEISQS